MLISLLAFLAISLLLSESTLTNALVHSLVLIQNDRVHGTGEASECPVHDAVAPVRSAGVCNALSTTRATNLAKSGFNKLLGVGDSSTGALDLGHCRSDQVGLNKLDVNTVGLHLSTQSTAPLLEESLASGIGGQKGSWHDTAKGSHREDQTTTTLDHARCNDLSDTKSTHAVDGDDVLKFLLGSLNKRNRHIVAQTNIVDENGDIEVRHQSLESREIRVQVLCKVHCKSLGLNRSVL
jgi:hypothetical protein